MVLKSAIYQTVHKKACTHHHSPSFPIQAYINRAKSLLLAARDQQNPYDGYRVATPQNAVVIDTDQQFDKYESIGVNELSQTAFVCVAGGLGERLGYQGIKLALTTDSITGLCYLEYYAKFILAFQRRGQFP